MGEKLIPRKRLSFSLEANFPHLPHFALCLIGQSWNLSSLLGQSLAEGNGIATFDSSSLGLAGTGPTFHWDGGSFSTFVRSQKIRAGDSWVSN